MTIIDDTESPKNFSAEAIDVLPLEDSRDVHISDTTEPMPSSSSTTQGPLGPSGEGHPFVVTADVKKDPLPGELEANSQVTTNQEVTPNQDVPAATPGPSVVSNDRPTALQERACHLLKCGQLPHFAPERRDWDKGGIFSFGLGDKDYPWPPHGWQEMDSDQRLLSAEFAVMALEFMSIGGFPKLSRTKLLEIFNFLVLLGSAKIRRTQEKTGAARTVITSIRS